MSNGAQAFFKTIVDGGIDTVFDCPGTSEMQIIEELGQTDLRAVLGLQENVVTGGFPDTETNPPEVIDFQKQFAKQYVPLGGRPGELREAGLAALFLASDASSFMTGEMLYLDGGMSRLHGSLD